MHCYQITSVYGLTEASPGMTQTTVDDPVELRAETVGKSFPEVEVRVIDPSTNKPVSTDTVGEICCRGYNVMKGYYKEA